MTLLHYDTRPDSLGGKTYNPVIASRNPACSLTQTIFLSLLIKKLHGASELYRVTNCRLSAKLTPTFADKGCGQSNGSLQP
jgi:hypothetical protein